MDARAADARTTGILHMAFDFASMARTFEAGTKDLFLRQIRQRLPRLADVKSPDEFNALHDGLCRWGCRTIRSSHAGHPPASYGQVAKTLNVVLKVVVYYCGLPDLALATRLVPWLHPAIDNPMMKYLRQKFASRFPPGIKTIASVDRQAYRALIDLAGIDISESFGGELHPIQWEDIVWVSVNPKG